MPPKFLKIPKFPNSQIPKFFDAADIRLGGRRAIRKARTSDQRYEWRQDKAAQEKIKEDIQNVSHSGGARHAGRGGPAQRPMSLHALLVQGLRCGVGNGVRAELGCVLLPSRV